MDLRTDQTLWVHAITLTAEPTSAGRAREFVRQHLYAHDLWQLVEDVQLVVSELATNAVVHAQSPLTASLCGYEGSLLLTVEDESPAVPSRGTAQVLDTSGRGLTIIDLVSRDWGVSTTPGRGKAVWASFDTR